MGWALRGRLETPLVERQLAQSEQRYPRRESDIFGPASSIRHRFLPKLSNVEKAARGGASLPLRGGIIEGFNNGFGDLSDTDREWARPLRTDCEGHPDGSVLAAKPTHQPRTVGLPNVNERDRNDFLAAGRFLRHEAQEPRVDPQVPRQLGVERGADEMALAGEDDPLLDRSDRLARSPGPRDFWGADEHPVKGPIEDGDLDLALEGLPLAAERIPVHRHVHQPEELRVRLRHVVVPLLREEDAPRARTEDWHPLARAADDVVEQPELDQELRDRCALPAGDRQGVD